MPEPNSEEVRAPKPPKPRISYNGITLFFIVIFLVVFVLSGLQCATLFEYSIAPSSDAMTYVVITLLATAMICSGLAAVMLSLKRVAAKIFANAVFALAGLIEVIMLFMAITSGVGAFYAACLMLLLAVPAICLAWIFNRAKGLTEELNGKMLSWDVLVSLGLVLAVIIWGSLSTILTITRVYRSPSPYSPSSCTGSRCPTIDKPVLYLYPENTMDVKVNLSYDGEVLSYPEIGNGWQVVASPDGSLINRADGREYSYLFWEGRPNYTPKYDMTTGFVVAGSATREFLQEKLAEMGLTPKEYNEFIVYWYPQMKDNPYNLIHFATDEEYGAHAQLDISPAPDKMLRVFMVFESLTQPVEVAPQSFESFVRSGFTVVEWGGSALGTVRHL
jgi:hypothetical protein